MIQIIRKRSSFWITGYHNHAVYPIEKNLSVYDVPTHRYTHFLYEFEKENEADIDGIMKIPSGIGEGFLTSVLKQNGIDYKIIDDMNAYATPRYVEVGFRPGVKEKDDYQKKAINFLDTTKSPQMFLTLDTGFGKTFCAIAHVVHSNMPALIISKNLTDQWLEKITEYTKTQNDIDIEILSGSKTLEEYINQKGFKKKHKASFYLVSIDTLRSFASRNGSSALQLLANVLGIGIKIFDEAHKDFILMNKIDINMQVKETIYLTATNNRSNKAEDRIFRKIFQYVPTHGEYTHLIKNYYYIMKYTYDSYPSEKDIANCDKRRGFNSIEYSKYIFGKESGSTFVYNMIKDIIYKVLSADPDAKILLLVDLLKTVQELHDRLEDDEDLKSVNISCGMYCTIVPDKQREKELDNKVIIGTLGSLQAGHDIANLRCVIPFTSYSSYVIARQLLGRLRPLEGKCVYYFDIIDEGFPSMVRQRSDRMKVFEPRARCIKDKKLDYIIY